jgi:hypothetical protein
MPMIVVRHKGESATFMTAFLPLGKEAIPTSIGGITADALKIASAAAPEDLPAGVGFAPGSGAVYIIAVSPAGSIYEITPLKIFTDAGLLAIETGKEGGDLIALHRFKTFSFGKEQGGINASAPVNYIEMLAGTAGRMAATAETEKENELTFGKDVIGGMASVCKSIAANLPDGSKQAVPADAPFKIDLPAGRSEFGFTCEDNKK